MVLPIFRIGPTTSVNLVYISLFQRDPEVCFHSDSYPIGHQVWPSHSARVRCNCCRAGGRGKVGDTQLCLAHLSGPRVCGCCCDPTLVLLCFLFLVTLVLPMFVSVLVSASRPVNVYQCTKTAVRVTVQSALVELVKGLGTLMLWHCSSIKCL